MAIERSSDFTKKFDNSWINFLYLVDFLHILFYISLYCACCYLWKRNQNPNPIYLYNTFKNKEFVQSAVQRQRCKTQDKTTDTHINT